MNDRLKEFFPYLGLSSLSITVIRKRQAIYYKILLSLHICSREFLFQLFTFFFVGLRRKFLKRLKCFSCLTQFFSSFFSLVPVPMFSFPHSAVVIRRPIYFGPLLCILHIPAEYRYL